MSKTWKIILISVAGALLLLGAIAAIQLYRLEVCNFHSYDEESHGIYVYPDMTMDSVTTLLEEHYKIASLYSWRVCVRKYSLFHPKPGYYRFPARIGNKHLIRRLQLGEESPIRLTFTNAMRTPEQLAKHLSKQLLLDSAEIASRLADDKYLKEFGMNHYTGLCLFLPNTYEVYWTISADKLFKRMYKEYQAFWNRERRHKADSIGLSPVEVSILASIVESETHRAQEHPTIASLYLNRLRKGIHLQACPTVIYATGNLQLRRVLKRHLAIDSPYNTYKYAGLPPGPIRCPNAATLDAVLNAPKTDYLYMCANPDFSGTHIFSSNYRIHSQTARQYQRNLNERKIK